MTLLPVLRDKLCDLLLGDYQQQSKALSILANDIVIKCENEIWCCNSEFIWDDNQSRVKCKILKLFKVELSKYVSKSNELLPIVEAMLEKENILTFTKYTSDRKINIYGNIYENKAITKHINNYLNNIISSYKDEIELFYRTKIALHKLFDKYKWSGCDELYNAIKKSEYGINNDFRLHYLNKYAHLLSISNKRVINLMNGEISPRTPEHYFTWELYDYDPNAPSDLFKIFIKQLCGYDLELYESLMLLLGYCFTGETSEKIYILIRGETSTGKSALCNVLSSILSCRRGHIFAHLSSESLIGRSKIVGHERHTAWLNNLPYSRIAMECESGTDVKLNPDKMKIMMGDTIRLKRLYKKPRDEKIHFKMIINCTGHVSVNIDDSTIKEIIVPFKTEFTERITNPEKQMQWNPDFVKKVQDNPAGGLNALIEYAQKYYQGRFDVNGNPVSLYSRMCDRIKLNR